MDVRDTHMAKRRTEIKEKLASRPAAPKAGTQHAAVKDDEESVA